MSNITKVAQVLEQIPPVMRQLAHELRSAREKLAHYEQRDKAEELVAVMEERGLVEPGLSRAEKVAAVLNSGKDLDLLKEAVQMNVGDFSSVQVSDQPGSGVDSFTQWIVSGHPAASGG